MPAFYSNGEYGFVDGTYLKVNAGPPITNPLRRGVLGDYSDDEINIVITDIMMPYKSGLEITAFSKKNYPSIPIIIVSALGKEDLTVIEGFKLGVDDFIAKPFNPIELVLRVKRFV